MICPPSAFAYSRPCASVAGGVAAVYVANPAEVAVTLNASAGTVTVSAVTANAKPFYKWEVADNASTLDATAQVNAENGSAYFQNVLNAVLNGFDSKTAGAYVLNRLSRVDVVVEYRDGTQVLLGLGDSELPHPNEGARLTGLTVASGAQRADGRRATVSFSHESYYLPLVVNGSIKNLVNA